MIITYTDQGWKVITQRAHGLLAAQFAEKWKIADRPERWLETLLAIAEHDDAEVELDGENLLTPAGGPLNFDMGDFDITHAEKLSMLTQTKSRYIALITSLHMEFLYRKKAADNKAAAAFLQQQTALRKTWSRELNLSEKEILRVYDLLEWCDACSLLLCQSKLQPEKRRLEISSGPDKKVHHLIQTEEDTLTIEPWPFEFDQFVVRFEWRMIEQLQFSSSAEFRKVFLKAPVEETVWNIVRENVPKKQKKV